MKKITLLTISALLLLTACGQVESSPTKVVPSPTTVVQEDTQQPQATPESVTVVQEPIMKQEQPQEEKAPQSEIVPQAAQTLEPVEEPAFSEDIPSETVHAKTGYVDPEFTPEPAPEPTAPADR